MDAGFILALPLHHWDLELDSVGVSTKSYLKIMCYIDSIAIHGWGAYARDKNTCARTLAENVGRVGGGLYSKAAYTQDTMVQLTHTHIVSCSALPIWYNGSKHVAIRSWVQAIQWVHSTLKYGHLRRDGILTSLSPWNHQILNSLHVMRLNIGACVNEGNCEANRFLERHLILFPAIFRSGCGLHTWKKPH